MNKINPSEAHPRRWKKKARVSHSKHWQEETELKQNEEEGSIVLNVWSHESEWCTIYNIFKCRPEAVIFIDSNLHCWIIQSMFR